MSSFPLTDHTPFSAPVAPMMASTSTSGDRQQQRISGTVSPPKLPSGEKSTQDYQADADRKERARDQGDPNYRTPSKRSRKSRAEPAVSPKASKKKSPVHKSYDECKGSASKDHRERHLTRIRDNWGPHTEEWMPRSVWPYKGPKRSRERVEDPINWSGPLLQELSYLSAVTTDKPHVAYQALLDAVEQRKKEDGLDDDDTQVLKEDVQVATQICKTAEPSLPSPGPTDEHRGAADELDAGSLLYEVTNGLPAMRSPTFAGEDPVIKIENQSGLATGSIDDLSNDTWAGYDDELDQLKEYKLEAEENEAIAAAKRAQRKLLKMEQLIRERYQRHGGTREDAIPVR